MHGSKFGSSYLFTSPSCCFRVSSSRSPSMPCRCAERVGHSCLSSGADATRSSFGQANKSQFVGGLPWAKSITLVKESSSLKNAVYESRFLRLSIEHPKKPRVQDVFRDFVVLMWSIRSWGTAHEILLLSLKNRLFQETGLSRVETSFSIDIGPIVGKSNTSHYRKHPQVMWYLVAAFGSKVVQGGRELRFYFL
jgi:hypothetical protein